MMALNYKLPPKIFLWGVRIAINKIAELRQRTVNSITLMVQRDVVTLPVEMVSLENSQLRLAFYQWI